MRTLVTGAAGFIGSTLVDRLLEEGHQVTGVDNLSAGPPVANLKSARRHNRPGRFTFVAADVRHPELSDIVAGSNPDVVFHLAAQIDVRRSVEDPQHDARNNVLGTINLLEASRRARDPRIVYATRVAPATVRRPPCLPPRTLQWTRFPRTRRPRSPESCICAPTPACTG